VDVGIAPALPDSAPVEPRVYARFIYIPNFAIVQIRVHQLHNELLPLRQRLLQIPDGPGEADGAVADAVAAVVVPERDPGGVDLEQLSDLD